MERKTGFEPATATLARWSSTGLSYFRSYLTLDRRNARNSKPPPGPRQYGHPGTPGSGWAASPGVPVSPGDAPRHEPARSPCTASSQRLNPVPIRRAAFAWR